MILKGTLSVNETLFIIIKVLGCLYIGYLGYQILKEALAQDDHQLNTVLSPVDGGLIKGFLVGISNPKDIIFFSSFFPQFIGIHSDINISLLILVIAWIILDFLTLSVVYLCFNRLSKSPIYPKILGLCGCILVFIAIYGLYISLQNIF